MASSSGTSSGSTTFTSSPLPNSGSEGDLQQTVVIDQRKQRRMLSNRESARRSRMRKQKHLDDLMAQVAQLKKENGQILATYKDTTQQYLAVEAENSILRAQMMELNSRLQSLNDILECMDGAVGSTSSSNGYGISEAPMDCFMMNPWNLMPVNQQQPIMASPADMLLY